MFSYVESLSRVWLCDPMDCSCQALVHGDPPGKNTVVSCHALAVDVKRQHCTANLFMFTFKLSFIHLSLAARVLHCCAPALRSGSEQGFPRWFLVLGSTGSSTGPVGVWASVSQHAHGLQSAGSVVVARGLSCSTACAIFLDWWSNSCALSWQADSYPLYHEGSPEGSPEFHLRFLSGFPGGSVLKNPAAMQETQVWSPVRKIPWRRKWQPTSVLLPGTSHGQRSLVGYTPWSHHWVRHDWATWLNNNYILVDQSVYENSDQRK